MIPRSDVLVYVAVPMVGICESAVIGKAVADLIASGSTRVPVEGLSPDRSGAMGSTV